MRERVGLATESPTYESPVDVDLMHRDIQHVGQCSVNVVGNLLGGVQSQSARRLPMGDDCVRLGESMVGSGKQPVRLVTGHGVLSHAVDVAELLEHPFLDVRGADVVLASVVNRLVSVIQSLAHVVSSIHLLILDLYQTSCFPSSRLVYGSDAGDQVSDVADLVPCHRVLVLGHRKHTEGAAGILSRCDGSHTW